MTNRIYVAQSGATSVLVINGSDNSVTSVTVGAGTYNAVSVDPVTNKAFVTDGSSNNRLIVIDGATAAWTPVATGQGPQSVATNPVTDVIYACNRTAGTVTVVSEATANDTKVHTLILPLNPDTTSLAQPALSGNGVNRSQPSATPMMGVLNRINTAAQAWRWATLTSSGWLDSIEWSWNWGSDSLVAGENLACALPLEADAATGNNEGLGSPFAGNMAVCPLYRVANHDVGVTRIMAPSGTIESTASVTPACSVYN